MSEQYPLTQERATRAVMHFNQIANEMFLGTDQRQILSAYNQGELRPGYVANNALSKQGIDQSMLQENWEGFQDRYSNGIGIKVGAFNFSVSDFFDPERGMVRTIGAITYNHNLLYLNIVIENGKFSIYDTFEEEKRAHEAMLGTLMSATDDEASALAISHVEDELLRNQVLPNLDRELEHELEVHGMQASNGVLFSRDSVDNYVAILEHHYQSNIPIVSNVFESVVNIDSRYASSNNPFGYYLTEYEGTVIIERILVPVFANGHIVGYSFVRVNTTSTDLSLDQRVMFSVSGTLLDLEHINEVSNISQVVDFSARLQMGEELRIFYEDLRNDFVPAPIDENIVANFADEGARNDALGLLQTINEPDDEFLQIIDEIGLDQVTSGDTDLDAFILDYLAYKLHREEITREQAVGIVATSMFNRFRNLQVFINFLYHDNGYHRAFNIDEDDY